MTCNICHFSSPHFLPAGSDAGIIVAKQIIGAGYRPRAICPLCGSRDRERLVFLYLATRTRLLREPARVLHFAPERCTGLILGAQLHLTYISADLCSPRARVHMSITSLAFPDQTFDAIIANHVLEHVEEDRQAMRELFRVLKPGGFAILQVPISYSIERTYENPSVRSPQDRKAAFGQSDHVRIYGPDYVDRLREAGFAVTCFDPAAEFGRKIVEQHSLIRSEVVFAACRPTILSTVVNTCTLRS